MAQSADLSLEVSVDDSVVDAGQEITFTIRVINGGPDTTLDVEVFSPLPSGYDFLSYDANNGSYNLATGIWNIGGMGFGINAILKITAIAKNTGEHVFLAEVLASDLLDYDSVPNNGVDTDGDGNAFDDPDDEDDGDGQLVIVSVGGSSSGSPPAGGSAGSADCLAPMEELSKMTPNPENIDGTFRFDYKINSLLNFEMADTANFNPEYSRGNPTEWKMEYYVNSSDGSILFPGGEMGFFNTNFRMNSSLGEIDAAIWLPNGQMVIYGTGTDGKRHAITRESIQTSEGRYQNDFMQIQRFISSSLEWGEWREPLPPRIDWRGDVIGYKATLPEERTGFDNVWIMYFDKAPTAIRTSVPMIGYMVGVMKDIQELQCNRLLVYSKVEIGGHDSGDAIEVELKSIRSMGITFDGSSYKPMVVGGDYGTAGLAKMDELNAKLRSIEVRKQTLERERKSCRDKRCRDGVDAQLEDLRREKSEVICRQMESMGLENFAECMRIEEEGY